MKNVHLMGIGDWGLGIGDWGLGLIPNPQSPFLISKNNIIFKIKYLIKEIIYFIIYYIN